jgi:hypothetical protein
MANKKKNSKQPVEMQSAHALITDAVKSLPAKDLTPVVVVTSDQKEIIDYLVNTEQIQLRSDVELVTHGIKDSNEKALRALAILTETFSSEDNNEYGFKIPNKFNFWWVMTNFSKIIKLVKRLIEIFKPDLDNKKVTQLIYG